MAVVAVEERQLLLPVRRVVGDVEVDRDRAHLPAQALALPLQHRLEQRFAHPHELSARHAVLEARQRRLRGQRLPADRITAQQQLVDRIVGQSRRVVRVLIATGQAVHALAE